MVGSRDLLDVLAEVAARPRMRGTLHLWAFFVSLVTGLALVVAAAVWRGEDAALACGIYALAVSGLLGTSATYHRVRWRRRSALMWMRRLDHAMIFVLIAGTYTPVALLALDGTLQVVVLCIAWGGAVAGIAFTLLWIGAPRWLSALIYVALGGAVVLFAGDLLRDVGPLGTGLLVLGGLLYTAGAVVYARQRPDPAPRVFGFHEVFHALVVLALIAHYAAIAFGVLPQA